MFTRAVLNYTYGIDVQVIEELGFRLKVSPYSSVNLSELTRHVVIAQEIEALIISGHEPIFVDFSFSLPPGFPTLRVFSSFTAVARAEGKPIMAADIFGNIVLPNILGKRMKFPEFAQVFKTLVGVAERRAESKLLKVIEEFAKFNPIKVQKVMVEAEFDKFAFMEQFSAAALQALHNEVETIKRAYEVRIKILKETIDRLKSDNPRQKAFEEGFNTALEVISTYKAIPEWDGGHLYLPIKVTATVIKHKGKFVVAPPDTFFVQGFVFKSSQAVYVKRAYHPNISSENRVCLGTLKGQPISVLVRDLPKTLSLINLDSCYVSLEASKKAKKIWKERVQAGEFYTEENIIFQGGA